MVLKYFINKPIWIAISLYLFIGLYLINVTYSSPSINIEIQEEDGQWFVKKPYFKKWADNHQIMLGDIVLEVNGTHTENVSNLKYDSVIRAANELVIKKPDGQIFVVKIRHLDIPQQFYYVLVIPSCYFLLTLFITLYIKYKQKNSNLIKLLILFILTVSLAYVSSGASSRLDPIGIIVNRSSMLLCLVILIHF